jgi:hypothetical protein
VKALGIKYAQIIQDKDGFFVNEKRVNNLNDAFLLLQRILNEFQYAKNMNEIIDEFLDDISKINKSYIFLAGQKTKKADFGKAFYLKKLDRNKIDFKGDMLFTPPGITGLIRLHAPFTSEEEIKKVVEFLKSQREVNYNESFLNSIDEETKHLEEIEDLDELFEDAKNIILTENRTSISYLQRRLNIGYNRAANIIEQMERMGILSKPNSKGQREILV